MQYYVYTLAYPDGTVFYVGKGSGNRIQHHEQEALRGHDCPKCDLIRSIWEHGGTVQRTMVFETDDERAALDHEAELIQSYGSAQLVNRRGGWSGRSIAPEHFIVPVSSVFADVLNHLFDTHRRPDGKEYTNHEVSKATDGNLSPTYLAKLRSGEIPNPGRYRLMLLCKFFHVPASYFFPELDAFEPSEEVTSPEDQLRAAFRTMGVPADIQAHLVAMAQAFKQDKEQDKSNE